MSGKEYYDKGHLAEEFIAKLCSNAFQQDFTFKNPIIIDKELCDVLIILQDKAIIWQIKSLKEKDGVIKTKEVEKAIRQCAGAMRKMKSLQSILLKNVAEEEKILDLTNINEYHLIVAIEDGIPNYHEIVVQDKDYMVNMFFSPFTRFALKYLNTVPDLLDYLTKKENLLKGKEIMIRGGEENLLAHFLGHGRSIGKLENPKYSSIFFADNDLATKFEEREEVVLRLEEEKTYSTLTDFLIRKRRESISSRNDVGTSQAINDLVLSLFLNMNSLEKRMFGKLYQESAQNAFEISENSGTPGFVTTYRSYYLCKKVLYIFEFLGYDSQKEKEIRQTSLQIAAFGAVKKLDLDFDYIMCIGSGIDSYKSKFSSYEWVFLDYTHKEICNEYIDRLFPDIDIIIKDLGILQNPKIHLFNQNEYEKSEINQKDNEEIAKYIRKDEETH